MKKILWKRDYFPLNHNYLNIATPELGMVGVGAGGRSGGGVPALAGQGRRGFKSF